MKEVSETSFIKSQGKTPLISIIVPIFNSEQYLNRCIDSLLNQTYTNIQIVLVDDGSTDESCNICAAYVENNERRLELFHSHINKGVSASRNIGLQLVRGEYVLFCDSDDYLEPTMVEKMVVAILQSDASVCICGMIYENEENGKFPLFPLSAEIDCRTLYNELLSGEAIKSYMCNKLYDVKLIEGFYFDERLRTYEDIDYQLRLFSNVKDNRTCVIIPEYLYHYNKHFKNSLSHSSNDIVVSCEHLLRDVLPHIRSARNMNVRKYKLLVYETSALVQLQQVNWQIVYLLIRNSIRIAMMWCVFVIFRKKIHID